jgi:glycosyltransferase involved in cell wall biosynthesis
MQKDTILVTIYADHEYYPPTLNALEELSKHFANIIVLYKIYSESNWKYTSNIKLISCGTIQNGYRLSKFKKIFVYIEYILKFIKCIFIYKPNVILVYDDYSLASMGMINFFINKKTKLWYHNHDTPELILPPFFSLNRFIRFYSPYVFKNLDLITFSSLERLKFYNLKNQLKSEVIELPNYPSLKIFNKKTFGFNKGEPLKLVFVGTVGENRGLFELIDCISEINKKINVTIDVYGLYPNNIIKNKLISKIKDLQVDKYVKLYASVPYNKIPDVLVNYNVGLGFYLGKTVMDTTIKNASNKIYEYAAAGLPVLTNISFNATENWIINSVPESNKLFHDFEFIINNYQALSNNAYNAFQEKYNYEIVFKYRVLPVLNSWV